MQVNWKSFSKLELNQPKIKIKNKKWSKIKKFVDVRMKENKIHYLKWFDRLDLRPLRSDIPLNLHFQGKV